MSGTCPHTAHRKTAREGEVLAPDVEVVDGVWHVRSFPLVKEVLRAGTTTVQAGFNVDMVREGAATVKEPILYMDGPEHKRQRSAIARYFAPATVSRRYRDLMESRADDLVARTAAEIGAGRSVDLSQLSLRYSVEVAAQVIGLTNSDIPGLARRLERLFTIPSIPPRSNDPSAPPARVSLAGRFDAIAQSVRTLPRVGAFYLRDVRPAVVARRAHGEEDVITHLIGEGYTDREILTECLTYAAAGMVTTREFISIATWHLLDDDDLRNRYLRADERERTAILHEILRLEPVVGHLFRRATDDMTLTSGEGEEAVTHHVPAGAVLDLSIRAANADGDHVGADPLRVCPERELAPGVRPEAMSFGDGNHRCPGNALSIQETDILLMRLLTLPLEFVSAPVVGWVDLIAGYELREVLLRRADAPTPA